MGEGHVFSLSTGGKGEGGTYSKVPTPCQGTYPPVQVRMGEGVPQGTYPCQGTYPLPPRYLPLPHPGQDGGRGTPGYLPPCQGTYPSPILTWTSGRYPGVPPPPTKVPTPPCRSGWGEGVPQGTYPLPRYLPFPPPGIGQHMEYVIRCGRYASCVDFLVFCIFLKIVICSNPGVLPLQHGHNRQDIATNARQRT